MNGHTDLFTNLKKVRTSGFWHKLSVHGAEDDVLFLFNHSSHTGQLVAAASEYIELVPDSSRLKYLDEMAVLFPRSAPSFHNLDHPVEENLKEIVAEDKSYLPFEECIFNFDAVELV